MNHECHVAAQYIVKLMLGVSGSGTTSSSYDRAIRAVERALATHYDGRFDLDAPNKFANVRKLTLGGSYKCDPFVGEAMAPFLSGKLKHTIPHTELTVDPGLVTATHVGEATHSVLYSADRDALQLDSAPRREQQQTQQKAVAENAPRQYSIVKVKGRADLVVPHEVLVGNVTEQRGARPEPQKRKTKKPLKKSQGDSSSGANVTANSVADDSDDRVSLNDSCSLADSQDCVWVENVGDDVVFDFVPSSVSAFDLYFPPTSQYELKTF